VPCADVDDGISWAGSGKIKARGRDERKLECEDKNEDPSAATAAAHEEDEKICEWGCTPEMRERIRGLKRTANEARLYEQKLCEHLGGEGWTTVYRWMDGKRVVYVGITNDFTRRCNEHRHPERGIYWHRKYRAQCLMDVPLRFVARGIEQALIEMYGTDRVANRNYDRRPREAGANPARGLVSGAKATLHNLDASIAPTPKSRRRYYCAAVDGGRALLRKALSNIAKYVPKGGWSANFPRRDCFGANAASVPGGPVT
jgi:hypothetical protein